MATAQRGVAAVVTEDDVADRQGGCATTAS